MEAVSILCQVQPLLRIANLYVKLTGFEGSDVKCSVKGNSLSMEINGMKLLLNFPKLVKLQDGSSFKATADDCYIHLRMPSGIPEGNSNGSDCTEVIQFPTITGPHLLGTKKKMWIPNIGVKSCLKLPNFLFSCLDDALSINLLNIDKPTFVVINEIG